MPTVEPDTVQTPRIDVLPKVTGQAVYTEDLSLPPLCIPKHGTPVSAGRSLW